LSSSDLVIDLGCGDGRWLTHISASSSCQCWGVEIDSNRLQITRQRIEEVGSLDSILSVILP
jgi:ubiquinone/menaquinone biosynthesis C-methylase UbiE